jgi:predicted acyltransferase
MFLLTGGFVGVATFVCRHVGLGEWCAYHIDHHSPWVGFSFWDIVMPLFIFICGASVPLALEKRLAQGRKIFWKHVACRFALLWVLGMCVQGNLASYDLMKIRVYCNTLQAIAVGYLIAAFVLTFHRRWLVPAMAAVLAVGYALMLHFLGDYTHDGNFARVLESRILTTLFPEGSNAAKLYDCTWMLTSLMFGAMTLCGMQCTYILTGTHTPWRKVRAMALYGAGMLVLGFGLQPWIPRIKSIYTLTFTAQAMGYCVLSWTVLYALTDVWRFRKGLRVFMLFGRNALFAYMTTHFFGKFPYVISRSFYGGLQHFFTPEGWNEWRPLVSGVCDMACMIVILHYWTLVKRGRNNMKIECKVSG